LKAEEGLTGRLKSPSGVEYQDLPDNEKIGGYPTSLPLKEALDLDTEGRAVVLELEPFIFISVYCPAVATAEREIYRLSFLGLLEERIKNLLALGKNVVVAGDLNICREPIDTADPHGAARRTESGKFEDTFSRQWLKTLLRPNGPFIDTGRHFNPGRTGMYTCWETRIQAREGNYGAPSSSKTILTK
jgi:AP endonuclease 2